MSPAICLNLDQSKILSSGNGLSYLRNPRTLFTRSLEVCGMLVHLYPSLTNMFMYLSEFIMEQYEILGRIGEGAHGIVQKAKHIEVRMDR